MRVSIYIMIVLWTFGLYAQNDVEGDHINLLIEKYSKEMELKCEIDIKIDVEGMVIPDKQVYYEKRKDQEPIIIGKGLTLLPKKGFIGQFNELFTTPLQPIFLSKRGENVVYKLVSLDPQSDWITADIEFGEYSLLIYDATITTRKQGTFYSVHQYENEIYPSKSVITFDTKKFKIPLKFIGRSEKAPDLVEQDKNVKGMITLWYKYL